MMPEMNHLLFWFLILQLLGAPITLVVHGGHITLEPKSSLIDVRKSMVFTCCSYPPNGKNEFRLQHTSPNSDNLHLLCDTSQEACKSKRCTFIKRTTSCYDLTIVQTTEDDTGTYTCAVAGLIAVADLEVLAISNISDISQNFVLYLTIPVIVLVIVMSLVLIGFCSWRKLRLRKTSRLQRMESLTTEQTCSTLRSTTDVLNNSPTISNLERFRMCFRTSRPVLTISSNSASALLSADNSLKPKELISDSSSVNCQDTCLETERNFNLNSASKQSSAENRKRFTDDANACEDSAYVFFGAKSGKLVPSAGESVDGNLRTPIYSQLCVKSGSHTVDLGRLSKGDKEPVSNLVDDKEAMKQSVDMKKMHALDIAALRKRHEILRQAIKNKLENLIAEAEAKHRVARIRLAAKQKAERHKIMSKHKLDKIEFELNEIDEKHLPLEQKQQIQELERTRMIKCKINEVVQSEQFEKLDLNESLQKLQLEDDHKCEINRLKSEGEHETKELEAVIRFDCLNYKILNDFEFEEFNFKNTLEVDDCLVKTNDDEFSANHWDSSMQTGARNLTSLKVNNRSKERSRKDLNPSLVGQDLYPSNEYARSSSTTDWRRQANEMLENTKENEYQISSGMRKSMCGNPLKHIAHDESPEKMVSGFLEASENRLVNLESHRVVPTDHSGTPMDPTQNIKGQNANSTSLHLGPSQFFIDISDYRPDLNCPLEENDPFYCTEINLIADSVYGSSRMNSHDRNITTALAEEFTMFLSNLLDSEHEDINEIRLRSESPEVYSLIESRTGERPYEQSSKSGCSSELPMAVENVIDFRSFS